MFNGEVRYGGTLTGLKYTQAGHNEIDFEFEDGFVPLVLFGRDIATQEVTYTNFQ